MGYDNFSLLVASSGLEDFTIDILGETCKKLSIEIKKEHDVTLFGEVHHLGSGSFGDWWWNLFDSFMLKLFEITGISIMYIYTCEFDGETLCKYEYIDGKRVNEKYITNTNSDPDVECYFHINTLAIKRNLSIFCNKHYPFEFTY